jgi:ubiquinone/menaquinone biosynthesis C-methylase UbiE
MHAHNPQAEQMGDESMARNLAHQAEAIWPQEAALFDRYALSGALRIADVGCGTGEITRRLAARYPDAQVLGLDLIEANLARARHLDARDAPPDVAQRISYKLGDAFHLPLEAGSVDLLVCRHMSQAVPDFPSVLREFVRVLAPGARLHLLSEDYGMLQFPAAAADPDAFWQQVVLPFLSSIGCDGRVGRHSPTLLAAAGFTGITMDYVTVDTLRVPRPTFAGILRAWRDGYAGVLAEFSGMAQAAVEARFDAILAAIETPPAYAVWHVPVISGLAPRPA